MKKFLNTIWKMIMYGPKNEAGLDVHDVRATVILVIIAYVLFKLVDAFLEYVYMGIFDIIKQVL
jgi:hypothetical protein